VIGEPPLEEGGLNETVAEPLPAVALTLVGWPGTAGFTVWISADDVEGA
jgi:hypothetical protein